MPDLGSGPVEVAIRTGLVYLFLVIALRLAGRREVGQMSILDLVVILVIANGVQNAMVGENTTLAGGLISAATLLILDRALNTVLKRRPPAGPGSSRANRSSSSAAARSCPRRCAGPGSTATSSTPPSAPTESPRSVT